MKIFSVAGLFFLLSSFLYAGGRTIDCDGSYQGHLQGVTADDAGAIYWSFTVELVKTDMKGKVLKSVPVADHHGDLTWRDGRIYVAANFGGWHGNGVTDSWIYVYDANDLSFISKHEVAEVVYGAGGIAYHNGRFVVVGGLAENLQENYVYEYDEDFNFLKSYALKSGYTPMGIQTAYYCDGYWWLGCYGDKLLKVDEDFNLVDQYDADFGTGMLKLNGGNYFRGDTPHREDRWTGSLVLSNEVFESAAKIELDPNLIGWWRFDEQQSDIAADSSGYGNDGIAIGTKWAKGKIGQALDFQAKGYVTIPARALYSLDKYVTVMFWQYGGDRQPRNDVLMQATQHIDGSVINIHIGYPFDDSGRVIFDAGMKTYENLDRIEKDARLENYKGRWNHWAFMKNCDTQKMYIYLNGKKWHSVSGKYRAINGSQTTDFKIGSSDWGTYNYDGLIDDVRIYNRPLKSDEIHKIYANSNP